MDAMNNTSIYSSSSLMNNPPSKPTVTTSGAYWYQPKPPAMWYETCIFASQNEAFTKYCMLTFFSVIT
ncbi:hypothetical protein SPOG_01334 [Schizosaccharomyces cryophilus OY26]|uniref:Uncharacterized protein n=1 Tax=Schizosaccharomyces cryophilus (strain OY26 / ATCC MYA-4695 / CBS 11777 / NBRC 106824 / NRRL Y48691) TaxID=653667 RepID=S9WXN1_SCHCR|nr:uncharacterized protein SPOG_01334 [Schizosaccharomyces cryophilus OY26]EPY49447.1 hypothetical protein SPOG_01334 [Schizosaccharomyces cryophilus OY26]